MYISKLVNSCSINEFQKTMITDYKHLLELIPSQKIPTNSGKGKKKKNKQDEKDKPKWVFRPEKLNQTEYFEIIG